MISNLQKRLNLSDEQKLKIEKEQADVVFNHKIIIAIVVIFFISLIAQAITKKPFIFSGLFFIVVLLIAGIILYERERKEFSLIVKDVIIRGLFQEQFKNVVYQPEKGLSEAFIKESGLYQMGNRFYSDDLLSATYKDVGFIQSDVLIQQVTSNGKTTTTTTLFKGRWLVCDFIKNFEGYHQIRANGFFKNKKPFRFFGDTLSEFEFEDQTFNDNYTTYTSDKREAYYLINPGYMQRIDNLSNFINKEVVYGFLNNKLHVAIYNNEDAFELKGNKINEDFVKRIDADIELIKLIIDELDLELDIFK
ncbi:MAG: DUF3137 domain-containing protein [Erysipelothrix sp.]|nr:DUF3137 domain-containing protein [Erysipelothrix sp.]